MFISNELTPVEMLAELLKGRRVRETETDRFIKLKHDEDLLPPFTSHVNTMLDLYQAYRTDAHDVQGMRDDGVDILMRFRDEGGSRRVAGIQIKSHDEFDRWEKGTLDLPKTLKAQYSAATENVGVTDYFVVLCVDGVRHRKRVRMLCSELKNYKLCTIIPPEYALGLFEMTMVDVLVRTTRLLCSGDKILRKAITELEEELPETAFFIVALAFQAFGGTLQVTQERLFDLWSDWADLAEIPPGAGAPLSEVLDALQGAGILQDNGADFLIDLSRLPVGVCALYFDIKSRQGEVGEAFFEYVVRLVGILDRLGESEEGNAV